MLTADGMLVTCIVLVHIFSTIRMDKDSLDTVATQQAGFHTYSDCENLCVDYRGVDTQVALLSALFSYWPGGKASLLPPNIGPDGGYVALEATQFSVVQFSRQSLKIGIPQLIACGS
ncbi:jg24464 [Pararge aegeria aegeria]|uniref:Jg24464 protein n=1 Tax=Pararge aegeria aegeria TaxID=348720 RepID=A0A8S4RI85_9NEOP|nr:jg24464 [Pararge aegeria aegeria]